MDFLPLFGIIFAFVAIILGQFLGGGNITTLLNGPAFLIVLGGSIGAVMIETPKKTFFGSLKMIKWIMFPPKKNIDNLITKILNLSNIARKNGVLSLSEMAEKEQDNFLKKGLDLIIDGTTAKNLKNVLEIEIENETESDLHCAKVFESIGGYLPTIGILGAVIGLIHVMGNLGEPNRLGIGIAVAFVATIYGVGLANIIFLPFANKLHKLILEKSKVKDLVKDGLIAIINSEHPYYIKLKLLGYKS